VRIAFFILALLHVDAAASHDGSRRRPVLCGRTSICWCRVLAGATRRHPDGADLAKGAARSSQRPEPDDIGEDLGVAESSGVGLGVGGMLGGAPALYADSEEREREGRPPRTTGIFGRLRRR